ncbi:Pre protein translocase subunit Sec66-domain-containing protein [Penicillium waksmanii]|uniref:Pre protein translocase subunit Sec66-domain-containing protein n=1 Tax=Penicillium waksmanii TaxID=69791 RepID=UPI002546F0B0|nr:Pre protein translocase subunit Sec66-domain-containing protein [Penicillium waksmanii]KAJ5975246.1 Pre protein translocase subunit Sec66-domain-containing protein [Penicillium waksmanii]
MVNWLSLAVPLAYLGHTSNVIFISHSSTSTPPPNPRKRPPNVPESVQKAALLRRATEDIRRVMTLRNQKQALSVLLQRGSVGDDLWQRFMRAEKEMEEEVRDVVSEANAYTPNWGQTIFQSANEMMNNEIYRQRIKEHEEKLDEERVWWEKKRTSVKESFMKELNEDETLSPQTQTPAAKTSETATPAKAAASVQGSDDDAVLVEADPSSNQASPSGGKKKKGKGKK